MTYDTIDNAQTMQPGGKGTLLDGRYRVVRQLGQGGMGAMWLVEDTLLDNKPFAVKMLPSILVSNKRAYAQLKAEALMAMKLVHPNIMQIRAFEENDGNPFLVMDYIDGVTLDDYLAEHGGYVTQRRGEAESQSGRARSPSAPSGGLPESDVLRILRPIAAALDYAHGEGVVHRDVKPANVMIRRDGHPFILDFGIAREIQETMTRVTGKLSSGTLLYMSPEQLMGESPKPAQDVYSFAAMAYECLKGEPPFVRGSIEDQIKNKQPEPLTGNAILTAGIMAGLAKKPEGRPATCAAVLEGDVLTQRRGDSESQSGRARSPSGPQSGGLRPPLVPRVLRACSVVLRCFVAKKGVFAAVALGLAVLCGWWLFVSKASHKGVQLWENGPYWAETNIGAEKPEDYGYYFWWGDTVGYKREGNAWVASAKPSKELYAGSSSNFSFEIENLPTCRKDLDTLHRIGWITSDGVLAPEHDAAHVHWGGNWRMPTKQELKDLGDKCKWTWIAKDGVKGYFVRGNGEYASAGIFLPAAGYGIGTSLDNAGSYGNFWSSVPCSDYYNARNLYFYSGGHYTGSRNRYYGQSVRPVQGFAK